MKTQIKTLLKIVIILVIICSLTGCINVDGIVNDNVSFQELHEHLGKYVGEEVTIKGYVDGVVQGSHTIGFYDASLNPCYVILLKNVSNVNIYRGWYTITGTVGSAQLYTCVIDVISAETE